MSASITELQSHLSAHPEDWESRLTLADALIADGKTDMAAMIVGEVDTVMIAVHPVVMGATSFVSQSF